MDSQSAQHARRGTVSAESSFGKLKVGMMGSDVRRKGFGTPVPVSVIGELEGVRCTRHGERGLVGGDEDVPLPLLGDLEMNL